MKADILLITCTERCYWRFNALLVAWLVFCSANWGLAQIVVPILDKNTEVESISRFGDETWVATQNGAYRIKGDSPPQRIPDKDILVESISHFGDETWLGTEDGAYRIKGDSEPQRIPDKHIYVMSISRFLDETWVATQHGAYRIKGDSPPQRIPDKDINVTSISHFGDETWLGTEKGAYRIKGDSEPQRILDNDIFVTSISHFGDETWAGTQHGAYRIKGDSEPQRTLDIDGWVHSISHFGDETWVGTEKGAYRIKGDSPPQRIPDKDIWVTSISHFGDETWVATQHGAYRIKGDSPPQRIPDKDIHVTSISRFLDETWLGTYDGAYRIKGDSPPQRIPDEFFYVTSISRFLDETWLGTVKGAYRIDSDVIISVFAVGADSWWKRYLQTIMPGNLWISGQLAPSAQYQRLSDHQDPYPKSWPREFKFVMERTPAQFDAAFERAFLSKRNTVLSVGSGRCTLFLAARDQWGNTFKCDPFPMRGWVIPGVQVIPVLSGIFGLGILALTIALAPFNTFCHELLMNPFVRKYGSFGLIPLAMTLFPPVRRHLLRRYFDGIARDESFKRLQQSYVVPTEDFFPEKFGLRMDDHRPILLLGSSGIGKTSFFRYLTFCYASKQNRKLRPPRVVPVFVPLARYQGVQAGEILHAQLSKHGRLTDKKLTDWFLEQGGFLFFLDGLNEIDDATRQLVSRFVDQYRNSSYFCLNSQQSYEEYRLIDKVELKSLKPEKIQALIKQQLGEEKALAVIAQFTTETYKLYAIPQDLQLAIALVMEGKPLPQSKRELYAKCLHPVFEEWTEAGRGDFPDLLTSRAYNMLCTRDPFFDQPNSPLPVDLTGKLLEKKVLIKRGDRLLFQHDLVRAYLASRHFVQQWKAISIPPSSHVISKWAALLADPELKVEANWRSMLEFTILEGATAKATKDLLLAVLNKNRHLAAELFKWAKELHPNLIEGWEQEFNLTYGKISLDDF